MSDPIAFSRAPMTLIVNAHEWHSRSIESVLAPHGFAVLRAYSGKQGLERAQTTNPDIILLDTELPDRDALEVCRELRALSSVGTATPIVMTSSGQASRSKRLEALRAGAWDFLGSSLDADELPLRLHALVRAKQEADRVREESLLDGLTGLYNLRGLARRARELGSQAFRHRDSLACLVVAPLGDTEHTPTERVVLEEIARLLRQVGRTSDAIGTLGPGEFAIVAQGTDSAGAERFAARVSDAAQKLFGAGGIRVAVGYDAVPDYQQTPLDPADMLMRATAAMRASRASAQPDQQPIARQFDGALTS